MQKAIEKNEGVSPFKVVVIFSNDMRSKAPQIGRKFNIPVILHDMRAWYKQRGANMRDIVLRIEYDRETVRMLEPFEVKLAALGGYMAIATAPILQSYIGVNVHPADLSIKDGEWRKYTGANVVLDAILAGERTISSSTHIVEAEVDMGRLLMISAPIKVNVPAKTNLDDREQAERIAGEHQDRLKEAGDWVIFPRSIEDIAKGKYAEDENGLLHYEGKPIPDGVRLTE